MKKYIILISVILLLSANKGCTPACNKDELPTYLMDENFKSYVDFPVGSYWIYQEISDNKLIDSVRILKRMYYIDNSGKVAGFKYDLFDLRIFSSYSNIEMNGVGVAKFYINDGSTYTEVPAISGSDNTQFFSTQKGVGFELSVSDGSKVLYKDSLLTYTVNNVSYPQVKVFENLIESYATQPRVIYYAKNVGVIRKELFNGQIWELQRYFINR
jgi:hypothetical protein